MRPARQTLLAGTAILAVTAIVAENVAFPQPARIVLGLLLVFALPGYAAVCAILPAREIPSGEQVLASAGASLAITTCVAVLLAATPAGLSRGSAAVTLGAVTAVAAACGWLRTRQGARGARGARAARRHERRPS
jgi:uncharacterized membrane protein